MIKEKNEYLKTEFRKVVIEANKDILNGTGLIEDESIIWASDRIKELEELLRGKNDK